MDALRRLRVLSRPRSFSAPSLVPDFSLPRSLVLSSDRSFRFVGDGALRMDEEKISLKLDKPFKHLDQVNSSAKLNVKDQQCRYNAQKAN